MSPLGIAYLLMNFEMAQHRFACMIPLFVCALGYVVGVTLWHDQLHYVAIVLGAVGTVAAVSLVALLPWRDMETVAHE